LEKYLADPVRAYSGTLLSIVPHDHDTFSVHLSFSPHMRVEIIDRENLTRLHKEIADALAPPSRNSVTGKTEHEEAPCCL